MTSWSRNQIAPVSNLAQRKVYLQVGTADTTVGPNVMAQLQEQLAGFVDASNMTYIITKGAAHTFPTDFDGDGENPCGTASSPYISNRGYDGAGAARNDGALSGSALAFEQTGSYGAAGMDGTGYVDVPLACQAGTKCTLHVALHGVSAGPRQDWGQVCAEYRVFAVGGCERDDRPVSAGYGGYQDNTLHFI
ncbi:putative polyhydroxybutyrate depolymerase [Aspergillus clavatus NRRL 1]|uniref:Uncharacterized protein n=1 Tax=Aspergillus clavatus (strain ATCC 1007 / CBS 513.65 / DSM 816 / NCTC 3887 / NRRL 1 / QM 1276 / 107) TaxID=344612 RepID=A1CHQ1_ASPCL|nr:uncharacterized protein ACLA_048780 [Aspergillus clavatus NRRL 1]EAW10406.1 conserved hypothetical protein [Aspergillus clavatus NRRL 1]